MLPRRWAVLFASIVAWWFPAAHASGDPSPDSAVVSIAGGDSLKRWYASSGEKPGCRAGAVLRALTRLAPPGSLLVTEIEPGATVRVRGIKLRPGRAETLRPALEGLGLAVQSLATWPDGPCDRFDLQVPAPTTGRQKASSKDAVSALFSWDAVLCQADRTFESGPVTHLVRHGEAEPGLTLRLRDVDAVMVFQALKALTGRSFIVDGDVGGRFDVDWVSVTIDEALDSLREVSGLFVLAAEPAGAAPAATARLFRVSKTGRSFSRLTGWDLAAPPVDIEVARGDLADVLRLLADVTGLALEPPEGPLGEVSVLTANCPADEILGGVLASAGLEAQWKAPNRVRLALGPSLAAPVPVGVPRHPTTQGWHLRWAAEPERFARCRCQPELNSILDFELAGVGRYAGPWRVLRFHSEKLLISGADQRLADGEIAAIDSDGVTLTLPHGRHLRLPIEPF